MPSFSLSIRHRIYNGRLTNRREIEQIENGLYWIVTKTVKAAINVVVNQY